LTTLKLASIRNIGSFAKVQILDSATTGDSANFML
jgi:hypothetical protein